MDRLSALHSTLWNAMQLHSIIFLCYRTAKKRKKIYNFFFALIGKEEKVILEDIFSFTEVNLFLPSFLDLAYHIDCLFKL